MRATSLARRSVALTAATALITGGLAAGLAVPAFAAAGTVTDFAPSGSDNYEKVPGGITVFGTFASPSNTVILKPACAVTSTPTTCVPFPGADDPHTYEVGELSYKADVPIPGSHELHATADLSMAAPGYYDVIVRNDLDSSRTTAPVMVNGVPKRFKIITFGSANAFGSEVGKGASGVDPLGVDCTAEVSNTGCGRTGPLPLDVHGANFSIGAKVEFLRESDNTVDTGLPFVPGNPSNDDNIRSTDPDNDTGYPNASLIQGDYATSLNGDTTTGTNAFTPGWHKIRVTNTDGANAGSTSRFAQPYFAPTGALSLPTSATATDPGAPTTGIGQGAKAKLLRITGAGIRAGSTLFVERKSTSTCADVSVGQSTLGGQQPDGLFTTITAPVTFADCTSPNNTKRRLGIISPTDGGRFLRESFLDINPAPTFTAFNQAQFRTLGQGAHEGFGGTPESNGVMINGTGFQGVGVPEGHPEQMTSFDFGPGVTVVTREVASPTTAFVSIDVANDAGTGERTVRVTNPDGGSTLADCDRLDTGACDPTPGATKIPLTITVGPKITKVELAPDAGNQPMLPGQAVPSKFNVTGTGFKDSGYSGDKFIIALPGQETQDPKIDLLGVFKTSDTALSFQASALPDAIRGTRDVIIENSDHGRFVCSDCVGIDSITITPTEANNNQTVRIDITVIDPSPSLPALTTGSRIVLSHQTPLPGTDIVGTGVTAPDAHHGSALFDLTSAALGRYNVLITLDPNAATPTVVSCIGCFKVTGAEFQLGSPPVTPADGGQGVLNRKLTFKGTDFTRGMQVSIPDVTVHDVHFDSPTQITALVDIGPDVEPGDKASTVTGGNGTSKPFTFRVNLAPTVSSISPAAYGTGAGSPGSPDDAKNTTANSPKADVTVTGDNFVDSPVSQIVLATGTTPDITVLDEDATVVASGGSCSPVPLPGCGPQPDTVKGHAAISQTAAVGKRAVSVVNNDGGVGTKADAFTVNPGPKITSIANPSGQPVLCRPTEAGCTNPQTITVLGSDFPSPTTDADKKEAFQLQNTNGTPATGVTVNDVTFAPGKITAHVTVDTTRAYGPLRAAVYNKNDKGFGSCDTCIGVATKPGVPLSLKLAGGVRSITATWAAPASNGSPITTYHLTAQPVGSTVIFTKDVPATARAWTFTGLWNNVTYVVKVQAVNAAGPSAPATATAVAGLVTSLSNAVSTHLQTAGFGVTLSGKLLHGATPVPFRTIKITIDPAVGATFTRSVTTTSTGVWALRYYPSYTFTERATFAGDNASGTYRSSVSPLQAVTVAARVTRTSPANFSRTSAGTTLKIAGNVAPNKAGTSVYLYRFVSGKKVLMARTTLSRSSTFLFSLKPGRGTYVFRVFIPATTGNAANYSSAFTLYRT